MLQTLLLASGEHYLTALYFANGGDNTVMKLDTGSGAVSTVATSQSNPASIVVFEKSLYWLNTGTGSDGSIMRLPL